MGQGTAFAVGWALGRRDGLGFGYKIGTSGQLTIEVDWYGDPRLHVMQPAQADLPRLVVPFEGDAVWIQDMANALDDLKQATANRI